jgi:hypothetical protein
MKKGCILIESRFTPDLVDIIIEKHLKFIPSDWSVKLYLSDENINLLRGSKWIEECMIRSILIEEIPEKTLTAAQYNSMLTSIEFWNKLPFDKVLIFQTDSEILREGIEGFLEYDYIGAPLYHIPFPAMNGGLSLRSKAAALHVIFATPYHPSYGNEDIYFCKGIERLRFNLPSVEAAKSFSVETIFGLGSMGAHAIDKWHTVEKCEQIRNQYGRG